MTFEELQLPSALIEALGKEKITSPTPIQEEAFPVVSSGRDAYLCSETGTGKTLAYLLPLICNVDLSQAAVQIMVLAPTHELSVQIHDQVVRLAQNSGMDIRSLALIGGASIKRQIEALKKKPQIVIGTPGRLQELLELRKLKVQTVKTVVLDEVDRLLHGTGAALTRKVVSATLRDRQLLYVSATRRSESAAEIKQLSPELVSLCPSGSDGINPDIVHLCLVCEQRDKPDLLRRLLHAAKPERALIFVHRNQDAAEIASRLIHHKLYVADLHGARDKLERRRALDSFRKGSTPFLIASDVAARGLDVRELTHVVNFDIPSQSKDYLHRAGRTARAGRTGCAISLVTKREMHIVRRIEREMNIEIQPVRLLRGEIVPESDAK